MIYYISKALYAVSCFLVIVMVLGMLLCFSHLQMEQWGSATDCEYSRAAIGHSCCQD